MVQRHGSADPEASARYRERHRAARHRAFLDTARRIVTTEGRSALTMQRVTDELGTSVGGIYLYFPTKDALLAELEAEALRTLHASFVLGQDRLEARLATQALTPAAADLTRAVAAVRFWIDAESTLPTEIELARRRFGAAHAVPDDEVAADLLPAARRLLEEVRARIAAAADAGALDPDDDLERAVMVVVAVNGVLSATQITTWGDGRFDGRRLARRLVDGLFVGWGASRADLDAADGALDDLAVDVPLAPVPEGDDPAG